MLEKIKNTIFEKYKKDETVGIFFSALDKNEKLIMSNGVVFSDKPLQQTIETIYHGLIEKYNNIETMIVDVVTETEKISKPTEINNISMQEYGILLITKEKYGALLPNTEGIKDVSHALQMIKQKNNLEGNAEIIKFKTDRFLIQ
ncbi:MAG TPA: hypothetical protein P5060_01725 [Candidatus Absconditabacterales bacterium]|nr:hypothetical protein [Candidatus Absconditabacterales bacterium]